MSAMSAPGCTAFLVSRLSASFTNLDLTTRTQGSPHCGHTPLALVPARMHGSTSFGGNVAKCASANGAVAIVQTERLLRLPPLLDADSPVLNPLCVPSASYFGPALGCCPP